MINKNMGNLEIPLRDTTSCLLMVQKFRTTPVTHEAYIKIRCVLTGGRRISK